MESVNLIANEIHSFSCHLKHFSDWKNQIIIPIQRILVSKNYFIYDYLCLIYFMYSINIHSRNLILLSIHLKIKEEWKVLLINIKDRVNLLA